MEGNQIKYPYMPQNRVFVYVDAENPFMKEARKIAVEGSTDKNQSTGAVVVRDGKIIGKYANQSAIKNKKLLEMHKNGWCMRRLLKIPSGQKYWLCPGCATHKNHAETGAVRNTLEQGNFTNNADLYLYGHWWCCEPCWNEMLRANIGKVYLLDNSHILFNKNHPDNIVGRQFV